AGGKPAVKCGGPWFVVAFEAEIEAGGGDAASFESGIDGLGGLQSADEESGGDQEDEADGDLRGDERIAQPAGGARAGGSAGLFQRRVEIGVGALEGGKQAKTDSGGKGQEQGV